jgi:hypothetical protein
MSLDMCTRHREKLYTEAGSRNQMAVESSKKWMLHLAHPSQQEETRLGPS